MVSERCYEKYIFSLELCHTKNEIKYLWQAIRRVGRSRALLKKFIDINQGLSMYLKCACHSESTYICTYMYVNT